MAFTLMLFGIHGVASGIQGVAIVSGDDSIFCCSSRNRMVLVCLMSINNTRTTNTNIWIDFIMLLINFGTHCVFDSWNVVFYCLYFDYYRQYGSELSHSSHLYWVLFIRVLTSNDELVNWIFASNTFEWNRLLGF